MKKLFLMALAVMAALSFTSCNELINPSQNDSEGETLKTVHFYAVTADPQTKTVFGEKESNGYPTLWTTNKQVYLALAGVGGTAVRDAPVIPSADQKTAQFEATIPQPPIKSEYVFKSISPSTAAAWTKADLPSAVSIPDEQTPTNASVDEEFLLACRPDIVSVVFDIDTDFRKFRVVCRDKCVEVFGIVLVSAVAPVE